MSIERKHLSKLFTRLFVDNDSEALVARNMLAKAFEKENISPSDVHLIVVKDADDDETFAASMAREAAEISEELDAVSTDLEKAQTEIQELKEVADIPMFAQKANCIIDITKRGWKSKLLSVMEEYSDDVTEKKIYHWSRGSTKTPQWALDVLDEIIEDINDE